MAAQAAPTQYYARRGPFTYNGKNLGRCELVALLPGAPNNEKLLLTGYIAEVPADAETAVCGECGREFLSDRFRRIHGDDEHRRTEDPDEYGYEGDHLERTMRQVNQEFPVIGVQRQAT